jgi:hypothetical protein
MGSVFSVLGKAGSDLSSATNSIEHAGISASGSGGKGGDAASSAVKPGPRDSDSGSSSSSSSKTVGISHNTKVGDGGSTYEGSFPDIVDKLLYGRDSPTARAFFYEEERKSLGVWPDDRKGDIPTEVANGGKLRLASSVPLALQTALYVKSIFIRLMVANVVNIVTKTNLETRIAVSIQLAMTRLEISLSTAESAKTSRRIALLPATHMREEVGNFGKIISQVSYWASFSSSPFSLYLAVSSKGEARRGRGN